MSLADILIIYLALGSPLMMHRYLTASGATVPHRFVSSLFALAFWVPLVVHMGYRHFSNAYSIRASVSKRDRDGVNQYVTDMRQILRLTPLAHCSDFSRSDFLETVERYAALATARRDVPVNAETAVNLFRIAGRESDIGATCVVRRNRRRIERHHIRARADLLELLDRMTGTPTDVSVAAVALRMAQQLNDRALAAALVDKLQNGMDQAWRSEHQPNLEPISAPLSALTIAIPPRSSD